MGPAASGRELCEIDSLSSSRGQKKIKKMKSPDKILIFRSILISFGLFLDDKLLIAHSLRPLAAGPIAEHIESLLVKGHKLTLKLLI